MITEEIPAKVAADKAYQNAMENSDKENAKVEHGKALERVMTAVLNDDTQLFSKFQDNTDFRRWLTQTMFAMTYKKDAPEAEGVATSNCAPNQAVVRSSVDFDLGPHPSASLSTKVPTTEVKSRARSPVEALGGSVALAIRAIVAEKAQGHFKVRGNRSIRIVAIQNRSARGALPGR